MLVLIDKETKKRADFHRNEVYLAARIEPKIITTQEPVYFYGVTSSQDITISSRWLNEMQLNTGPTHIQGGRKIKREVNDFSNMPIWKENGLLWDKSPEFGIGIRYSTRTDVKK